MRAIHGRDDRFISATSPAACRLALALVLLLGLTPLFSHPTAAQDDSPTPDFSKSSSRQSDDESTPTDGEYTGENFGYTLEFDPDEWQISEQSSNGGEDYLVLSNSTSFLTLFGTTGYGDDVEECRSDWIRSLRTGPGIEDFRPLEGDDGEPVAGESRDSAFAAYAYTSEDGDEVFHIDCQVLIPDEATLSFMLETFADDYDDQLDEVNHLLDGLDVSNVEFSPVADTDTTENSASDEGTNLTDDFDDPDSGVLSTTSPDREQARYGYIDGEYVIETLADDAGTWQAAVPGSYTDATIAVDVSVAGETENRYVLIGCRYTADGEYDVNLSPADGYVSITRWDSGEETVLAEDTRDDVVNLDNDSNHVELSCVGDTITASVNGEEVLSVEDDTYDSGRFILAAGVYTGESGTVESHWDNLEVTLE